jgi:hypothetical protein
MILLHNIFHAQLMMSKNILLIITAAKTSYLAALSNILQNCQMSLELAKSLYLNLKIIVGEEKEKIQAILKIKNY